uniref:Mucin-13 n=1 Tax=Leptobrachium leishanense TaxID=445787 RepID=A0A8C5QZV4_9ANUR
MKGFILLGALLLAIQVKDAKATFTSVPTTESITSVLSSAATETDKSSTVIISTDKSITTADISTTTADKSTITADKSITTADKSTITADKVSAETDIFNTATDNFTTVTTQTGPGINTTNTTIPSGGNTCDGSRCGTALCVQLYNSYICQCPLTQSYNKVSMSCVTGYSVFGEIILTGRNFSETPTSEEYTNVYNEVIGWFRRILEPEYKNYTTTVIESLSVVSSRRQMRSEVDVKADATSQFSSSVSPDEVNGFIKGALDGFGTYESRSICDFACDSQSMSCRASADGQNSVCVCLEGHFKKESHRIDTCNSCGVDCKAGEHRGCVWNDEHKVTDCQCLAGYKEATNGECKACDFGYSGQDCKDNFLLILVIVGSVAGGVIIALLGAVIGISVRSGQKKKDNERTELLPTDRNSGSPSPVAGNLFPKVQVKNDQGHVNTASNLYEDEHYSRSFPQRDYDENPWYEMNQPERRY